MQRDTRQRRAIRATLEEAGHPMSPKELLKAAKGRAEGLGIATVYRNLRHLQEAGSVTTVELPGEPPRYEISGKAHHHHFLCRKCDRVYELDGCPSDVHSVTPSGFRVEGHELVLYGLCAQCA
jgi:Fur family transcriptional regulator, ferric uptake regulator